MKNGILGLLSLLLAACTGKDAGYTVNGSIAGAGDGIVIVNLSPPVSDENRKDTIEMRQGHFVLKGKLIEPGTLSISVIPSGESPVSIRFMAENAPIQLTANWEDVKTQGRQRYIEDPTVTGSLNQEVYHRLAHASTEVLKRDEFRDFDHLRLRVGQLQKGENSPSRDSITRVYYTMAELLQQETKRARVELVKEYRAVAASAILLSNYATSWDLELVEELVNQFDKSVQSHSAVKSILATIKIRRGLRPGNPAPGFTLKRADGTTLSLQDLRGKYVVIDFWASWCVPCRAAIPEMKRIYQKYQGKNLEFLGISIDDREANWHKALEEEQLPWEQVIDEASPGQLYGSVSKQYAVPHIPYLYLIAPDGKMICQPEGVKALALELEKQLN